MRQWYKKDFTVHPGDGVDENTDMSPLIDKRGRDLRHPWPWCKKCQKYHPDGDRLHALPSIADNEQAEMSK